jgi:hypothetical protein
MHYLRRRIQNWRAGQPPCKRPVFPSGPESKLRLTIGLLFRQREQERNVVFTAGDRCREATDRRLTLEPGASVGAGHAVVRLNENQGDRTSADRSIIGVDFRVGAVVLNTRPGEGFPMTIGPDSPASHAFSGPEEDGPG